MKIFQYLQSLLANTYKSNTFPTYVASLKHIIICRTHALLDLCQSWKTFCQELVAENPYQASIKGIRLRLVELQVENGLVRKIKAEKLVRNYKDFDRILYFQSLPYISEIIRTELMSRYHGDPLVGYFSIKKTWELVTKKYYWETLYQDIEVYVKGFNVCLVSKVVRYKLYKNL